MNKYYSILFTMLVIAYRSLCGGTCPLTAEEQCTSSQLSWTTRTSLSLCLALHRISGFLRHISACAHWLKQNLSRHTRAWDICMKLLFWELHDLSAMFMCFNISWSELLVNFKNFLRFNKEMQKYHGWVKGKV